MRKIRKYGCVQNKKKNENMSLIILNNFYTRYKKCLKEIMFTIYFIYILNLLIIYMYMFDDKKNKFAFKILR